MTEAPWMLAPAVALFVVVFAVQLIGSAAASSAAGSDFRRAPFLEGDFDSLGGHDRAS